MARRPRRPVDDPKVEIIPPAPRRGLVVPWPRLVRPALVGVSGGFLASLVLGGGGLLRHLVVGLIGYTIGVFVVRISGWRLTVGNLWADQIVMSALGAMVIILIARLIG